MNGFWHYIKATQFIGMKLFMKEFLKLTLLFKPAYTLICYLHLSLFLEISQWNKSIHSLKKQFLILSLFILIKTMLGRKLGLDTSGSQQLLK